MTSFEDLGQQLGHAAFGEPRSLAGQPPAYDADADRVTALMHQNGLTIHPDVAAQIAQLIADARTQAVQPFLDLAREWNTDEDARYSHARIAKQTAARAIREALEDVTKEIRYRP
jgi:hypothetical protein